MVSGGARDGREQLDRIGEQDRRRAEQGLVAVMDRGGRISHKHVDHLGTLDMNARTAAERVVVDWLKERVERRALRRLSYPHTYAELLGTP